MLQQFQNDLEKIIGRPTGLRPFVCDGSPLECKIFIVGFNPATELKTPFWDFWQPDYGFQKTEWLENYKQERRSKPLSPGKTRRNEISNTRRVIEWIIEEAMPLKCLETNIYSKPTERVRDLPQQDRLTEPFDFLLRAIRPQVIFIHGKEAAQYIEAKYQAQLKMYTLQPIQLDWGNIQVMAGRHLSRGWSQKRAREVGRILREGCFV